MKYKFGDVIHINSNGIENVGTILKYIGNNCYSVLWHRNDLHWTKYPNLSYSRNTTILSSCKLLEVLYEL